MQTLHSENQNAIVRLAAAANPFQAHIWQHALQQEGIRCQVLGDYLDADIGDIPGIRADVWVEAAEFALAEAILHQHQNYSEGTARPWQDPLIPGAPDKRRQIVGNPPGRTNTSGQPRFLGHQG
jgi:hypothetical protein